MRPIKESQSALRAPLNEILGTEASVRILRVLGSLSAPISTSELAKRTKLQRSSVHRASKTLEETGVVEYVGTGPHLQLILREKNPLTKPIRQLFRTEQSRYEELIAAVKRVAHSLDIPPIAVWVEGSVATSTDKVGDPLVVSVLDNDRSLERTAESLRMKLTRVEQQFDIQIEIRPRTRADLDALSVDDAEMLFEAIPLVGVPPAGMLTRYQDLWRARNIRAHSDHDLSALEFGRAIADAVSKDPSLITDARRYIERRWKKASAGERKELAEWKRILTNASPSNLRKLLTAPTERATRLRQTVPFIGIFSVDRRRP